MRADALTPPKRNTCRVRPYYPPMIRLLTPSDAPAFAELRRLMLRESPWAFSSSPETDRASDPEFVAARFASASQAIAGAFDDDRLLSAALLVRDDAPKRVHIANIYSVYTHPDARRRGLCRAVCSLLLETVRSWSGVEVVQISVSERAAEARALYESLGFTIWGVEPDALRIGGVSLAERHMLLRL